MIDDLDEALRQLLIREIPINNGEVDIEFKQPTREWSARLSRPTQASYQTEMQKISTGEGRAPTAFDWRASSTAQKQAGAFGVTQGIDYFKTVLLPALAPALNVLDQDAEVDLVRIPGGDAEPPSQSATKKHGMNVQRMRGHYARLMGLFTAGRAGDMPLPVAQFCAGLHNQALTNGMDEENAYLLVSSQIFLRMINPMITGIVTSVPTGERGKRALTFLMKLLQDDANNIEHGKKEEIMSVFADMDYTEQIWAYVNAVIERGRGEG